MLTARALPGGFLCAALPLWAGEANNEIGIWKAIPCEDEQQTVLPRTPGHTHAMHTQALPWMRDPSPWIHVGALAKPGTNPRRAAEGQKIRATILPCKKDLKESEAHFAGIVGYLVSEGSGPVHTPFNLPDQFYHLFFQLYCWSHERIFFSS